MTTYYVGPGGADTNAGTTWATRFLTVGKGLGAVAAGDTLFIGPGAYYGGFSLGASGTSASPIKIIGDVTGQSTDGIGGTVRLTGAATNNRSASSLNVLAIAAQSYYTFQGLHCDTATTDLIPVSGAATNLTFTDCTFDSGGQSVVHSTNDGQSAFTFNRCLFIGFRPLYLDYGTAGATNTGHKVTNCVFFGCQAQGILITQNGGVAVSNCTFVQCSAGIYVNGTLPTGFTADTVTNSLFVGCVQSGALLASTLGYLTEDYNAFFQNGADRTNVGTGTHSTTYPPSFALANLASGLLLPPPQLGSLSEWSAVGALTDNGSGPTDDFYGLTRPTTNGKRSWGAIQNQPVQRNTTTVYSTDTASLQLTDAGQAQLKVPVTNVSTTFSVYVYREAGYTGTNPQMVIRQAGVADTVVTDTGAAGGWNQLTTTVTPAANPGWLEIILVSGNTATSGSYSVYFDSVKVS